MILGFLLKNPYILIFTIISLVGLVSGYTLMIYNKGVQSERAVCNIEKQEAINENIDIKKKQDNVIRSGTASYIASLRKQTF